MHLAPLQIVALPGSLRRGSVNRALLQAAQLLAPWNTTVRLFDGIGALPLFSPDLESAVPPGPAELRSVLVASDAILIACPEYAHGVPGAFKNALDWVVGCADLPSKPVGLLNAALRAEHAQAALAEIIATMNHQLIQEACLRIPISKDMDASAIVRDEQLAARLSSALSALAAAAIRQRETGESPLVRLP